MYETVISTMANTQAERQNTSSGTLNALCRHVDKIRTETKSLTDLFAPMNNAHRLKLRNHCEKVIFDEKPSDAIKWMEVMWQKCYHDVIATAKTLDARELETRAFIDTGIGFYRHLINRLQIDNDLRFAIDFPLLTSNKVNGPESVMKVLFQCLVHVGDLMRYKHEFDALYPRAHAHRYYMQAIMCDHEQGIAHNQLGTLFGTYNHGLDAVYHYLRCLSCRLPFAGAAANLSRIFSGFVHPDDFDNEPNAQILIKRFLYLAKIWNSNEKCDADVFDMCYATLLDLQECLELPEKVSLSSLPEYLDANVIFKMTGILLMSCDDETDHVIKAFTLAFFSYLIIHVVRRVKVANGSRKRHGTRRRRALKGGLNNSDGDSDDFSDSNESIDSNESTSNAFDDSTNHLLQSVKILCDWLKCLFIKTTAPNDLEFVQPLIYNLVEFVNYLNCTKTNCTNTPLPEDYALRDLRSLRDAQTNLNWRKIVVGQEETRVRSGKFHEFAVFLTTVETLGVTLDDASGTFKCNDVGKVKDDKKKENGADQDYHANDELMKNMGQLWLAAQVRDLEHIIDRSPELSPYLIVDADALNLHLFKVKQLVSARKFIVVIPTIVLSTLDELKRTSAKARDAIRWLEVQFRQGNRFVRAQRNHESAVLPYIKYPKKKEKQMTIYIRIIEFCYYLVKQQHGPSKDLITLLTGQSANNRTDEMKNFSYVGLAQTAGVAVETIVEFCDKWKSSMKKSR